MSPEAFLGAEPEETQRLKVVGELMRQNLKVIIHLLMLSNPNK